MRSEVFAAMHSVFERGIKSRKKSLVITSVAMAFICQFMFCSELGPYPIFDLKPEVNGLNRREPMEANGKLTIREIT